MADACANHPETASIAKCARCEKLICGACLIQAEGAVLCSKECVKAS